MARPRTKLPRVTPKGRVDQLIEWYERHRPDAGAQIPVHLSPKTLGQFATATEDPKVWRYRGRNLVRE